MTQHHFDAIGKHDRSEATRNEVLGATLPETGGPRQDVWIARRMAMLAKPLPSLGERPVLIPKHQTLRDCWLSRWHVAPQICEPPVIFYSRGEGLSCQQGPRRRAERDTQSHAEGSEALASRPIIPISEALASPRFGSRTDQLVLSPRRS